jgi:hypothetical protein
MFSQSFERELAIPVLRAMVVGGNSNTWSVPIGQHGPLTIVESA